MQSVWKRADWSDCPLDYSREHTFIILFCFYLSAFRRLLYSVVLSFALFCYYKAEFATTVHVKLKLFVGLRVCSLVGQERLYRFVPNLSCLFLEIRERF
jgi:hypothetical protein